MQVQAETTGLRMVQYPLSRDRGWPSRTILGRCRSGIHLDVRRHTTHLRELCCIRIFSSDKLRRRVEIIASRMIDASTGIWDAWDLSVRNSSQLPTYWFYDSVQHSAAGTTAPIEAGQWHSYIVSVQDHHGGVYIDGALVASFTQSGPLHSADALRVCIACNDYNPSSAKHFLNGDLDDLRFYSVR